jgi:hypothetical protein
MNDHEHAVMARVRKTARKPGNMVLIHVVRLIEKEIGSQEFSDTLDSLIARGFLRMEGDQFLYLTQEGFEASDA